jgi:uncharacterized protein YjbJ (UPF0337 family)
MPIYFSSDREFAMIAQDVLEGKWHTIRGKLKTKWAKLTDDDLLHVDGGIEQLIGRIQRRTGESREAIEHFIDQAAEQASNAADRVSHTVHESLDRAHQAVHQTLDRAGQTAGEAAQQVADGVRDRYQQAERAIHNRPAQAVLVAFGVGLVSGLGVALLLTSHRREQAAAQGSLSHAREHLGRHLSDAIMHALPQSLGGRH